MKTSYSAKGYVVGNHWGGKDKGAYPSEEVKAETLEELKTKIEKGICDGSLDSGFGFQNLIGAYMCVTTHRTIEVEEFLFENTSCDYEFYGQLTESDVEFLSSLNF